DHLARANGFVYFHFLQPNQYVAGSKTLSHEEKTIAIAAGPYSYREAVHNNYPSFIHAGSRLRELENFTDLTSMFKPEARTVYADRWCQFNELGINLIGEQIARVVSRRLSDKTVANRVSACPLQQGLPNRWSPTGADGSPVQYEGPTHSAPPAGGDD